MQTYCNSSPLFIETLRLTIKFLLESDRAFIVSLLQSSLMVYMRHGALTEKEANIEFDSMISGNAHDSFYCLIYLRELKSPIGWIKLYLLPTRSEHYQLGYMIASEFQGSGFATEAAKAMIDYAFNVIRLDRLEAYTQVHNLASQKVLQKVGMNLECHSFIFEGRRYYQFAAHNLAEAAAA